MAPVVLSKAELEAFDLDGAVVLRDAIGSPWLDALRAATDQVLTRPGPYHVVNSSNDDPGFFCTEYYVSRRFDPFRRFTRESPAGEIAARLLRSETVRFFFDGLFVKEPHTEKASQWHQDQPYYPVDGWQVMVLWVPLDPVDRDSCLRIVRGSHRWGKWFEPVLFREDVQFAPADSRFEPLPDLDAQRDRYEFLSWDMTPGDCIAFHGLALHGAAGNPSARRRRALSTTWLGDDTVFAPRAGELEPQFAGLRYAPGEALVDETEFPRVWPRPSQ